MAMGGPFTIFVTMAIVTASSDSREATSLSMPIPLVPKLRLGNDLPGKLQLRLTVKHLVA
jgi:hypothetical protein